MNIEQLALNNQQNFATMNERFHNWFEQICVQFKNTNDQVSANNAAISEIGSRMTGVEEQITEMRTELVNVRKQMQAILNHFNIQQ